MENYNFEYPVEIRRRVNAMVGNPVVPSEDYIAAYNVICRFVKTYELFSLELLPDKLGLSYYGFEKAIKWPKREDYLKWIEEQIKDFKADTDYRREAKEALFLDKRGNGIAATVDYALSQDVTVVKNGTHVVIFNDRLRYEFDLKHFHLAARTKIENLIKLKRASDLMRKLNNKTI
jgi:hypothetical protein